MGSLVAAYRAYTEAGASLDVLVGARAWWLDLQIDYRAGSLPAKSVEKSKGWVDPIVGLRGQISVTDKIFCPVLPTLVVLGSARTCNGRRRRVSATASIILLRHRSAIVTWISNLRMGV